MIDAIVYVTQYYDYDALTYELNVKLRNKNDRCPVARNSFTCLGNIYVTIFTADENL